MEDKKWGKKYIYYNTWLCRHDFLLSGASSGVSLASFATAVGAPVGMPNVSFSLVLLFSNRILNLFESKKKKEGNTEKLLYQQTVNL